MTGDDLVSALELPAACTVGRRIPKTLLIEQGSLSAPDKRQVNEGIVRIHWQAVVKAENAGVPEYRDDEREYLEIAVIQVEFRPGANRGRLRELLHRVVPYPVLLVETLDGRVAISLAHQRFSLTSSGVTVIDGVIESCELDPDAGSDVIDAFGRAIALGRQPRQSMMALYAGWLDTLAALQAARITGRFREAVSPDEVIARRDALERRAEIRDEMASLRAAAKKTKQVARLAEINTRLQHLKERESDTVASL